MQVPRGRVQATIIYIINSISFALYVFQFNIDWTCANGDLVFTNFSFLDKSVSCFKLYITGYDALHTQGSEMFGFVCMLGWDIHLFAIAFHHVRNHRTWTRTRILLAIFILPAGGGLLYLGILIPEDNAWHTHVVPAVIIVLVLIEGALHIRAKINRNGENEQYRRDLLIKSAETAISIVRFVDLKGRTHKPWDADKILHLVGSGLPVLIGICLIGLMLYDMCLLFISKLIEWRINIARFFTVDEEGSPEEQQAGGGAHVALAVRN